MSAIRSALKLSVAAAAFVAIAPIIQAQDRIDPQEAAAQQAQTQRALAEGGIANNRPLAVDTLVRFWQNAMPNQDAALHFQATLNAASTKTLLRVYGATSFEQVRTVLRGQAPTAPVSGAVGIQNLGDVTNDLTFTPVTPCRIFDTRFVGNGLPPAAESPRHYQTYGDSAMIGAQGGNPSGCAAPRGEPAAVAINMAVVPSQAGFLRLWPFGQPLPGTSYMNFDAGMIIANSGIVGTCFLCASDITVQSSAQTHHIGDVMGYFYPVSTSDPALQQVKTVTSNNTTTHTAPSPLLSDDEIRFVGPTVTLTIGSGDVVHITATHALGAGSAAATNLDLFPCRLLTSGAFSLGNFGLFDGSAPPNSRLSWTVTGVFAGMSAGTHQLGMCYRTSSPNWSNNNFGTVTAIVLNPL
jgi:hypothetical protein